MMSVPRGRREPRLQPLHRRGSGVVDREDPLALRIVHTADLHLGHTLHGVERAYEHDRFLGWLLDLLEERQANALLVSGDVFDSSNPPAQAVAKWYRFLAQCWKRLGGLQVVVCGGNHDSAARLDAADPLLAELGRLFVLGAPPRKDGALDAERLVVPLTGPDGKVQARVVAMPFIRGIDLPQVDGAEDPLVAGVRSLYDQAFAAARAQRQKGEALIAMGHCYLAGGQLSELSERKLFGGNLDALPLDVFPKDVDYVALGHLHRAQVVGGQPHVRYSGSVIPLSIDERHYEHQVLVADFAKGRLAKVEPVPVPRAVDILRVPDQDAAPLAEVLAALEKLPPRSDKPADQRPILEVQVELAEPEPNLRAQLDAAVAQKDARLVRIAPPVYAGKGKSLAEAKPGKALEDLDPKEVFEECWKQQFGSEPTADDLAAFAELREAAEREEGGQP